MVHCGWHGIDCCWRGAGNYGGQAMVISRFRRPGSRVDPPARHLFRALPAARGQTLLAGFYFGLMNLVAERRTRQLSSSAGATKSIRKTNEGAG